VPSYELITTPEALVRALKALDGTPLLALDTEASSFHRYQERVCLVQLSDRERTLLVDPLAITDLAPLGTMLADPAMQVVIHDADYDLRILAKYHRIRVENVFDTLVAAELLNEPEIGLAALLLKYQGVKVDYAAGDTANLIALRDILEEKLHEKDRWTWVQEEFALLTDAPFNLPAEEEPAFLKMKGAKMLKPHQLAVFREVHGWREGLAAKMDRAPFMVFGNEALLSLATEPPRNIQEVLNRKGVNTRLLQRHGQELMEAIERGLQLPKEEWPRIPRPKRWDRDDDYEERLKRLKQVRDRLTLAHDLRPGIVAANQMLMDIARTLPGDLQALAAIPGIRRYQVEHFGADLLKAL
jgi:ribonuclease D